MPIVLAIEPDRRQAAHLTTILRRQVGAELILADTTEGALDAIGNRMPDLVLVPALLSPQDDAALAAALRVIAAATHVRTLTTPALASGTKRAKSGGMLAMWRQSRAASPEPDGCDPAVFGEQISAYLREAAAEREELDDQPLDVVLPAANGPVAAIGPPALPPPVDQPLTESIEPWALEPIQPWAAQTIGPLAPEPIHPLAAETVQRWAADAVPLLAVDSDEQATIDLSEDVAALSDEAGDELFAGERVGVYVIPAETEEAFEAFDLLQEILEPHALARHAAAPVAEAAPEEVFVEPSEPPRADIEPWVPMYLAPGRMWPVLEGMPVETSAARTELSSWVELVASLRQDLERRRTDPPPAAADPMAARPSDGSGADAGRLAKQQKQRARKSKPIEDEWGFFDPQQCGFSALLAKLDDITNDGAEG